MQQRGFRRTIIVLTILVVVVFVGSRFRPTPPPVQERVSRPSISAARDSEPAPDISHRRPGASSEPADETDETGLPMLDQEKIEEYFIRHKRDLHSLLAAFHASGEMDYLREAATNFPTDPHLQSTVLARNAFPENRREWLEAFKVSSPENSLANYLSAREYFQKGETQAAIDELAAATGKAQFKDFALENQLDSEQLSAEMGGTGQEPLALGMAAAAQDLLPELTNFKGLTQDVMALQKQYASAGDSEAAASLAQMALTMADRFNSGGGSKFLICQLVGIAMEAIVLKELDPNASYDFLGGKTVKERSDALKERRAFIRELTRDSVDSLGSVTDAEWSGFSHRQKIYGEIEAAKWLQQQRRAATPNTGN